MAWSWPLFRKTNVQANWEQFVDKMNDHHRYTKDMVELEQVKFHNFFYVGDGHSREILANTEELPYYVWSQSPMAMLKNDLGKMSHPLLFEKKLGFASEPKRLPVMGNVFRVTAKHLHQLDKYYSNTVMYERKLMMIVVPVSEAWFKDRRHAEIFFGGKQDVVNTALFKGEKIIRKVFRAWAWVYYAKPDFWNELLSDYNNPPVRSFKRDGLIKEYYCFTDAEVKREDPPF